MAFERHVTLAIAALLSTASPAFAGPRGGVDGQAVTVMDQRVAYLVELAVQDARVNDIGFRIARAAANRCPDQRELAGITLHSASQYAQDWREAAQQAFGFRGEVAVAAVAEGSTWADAGLHVGDRIVAIGDTHLPAFNDLQRGNFAQTDDVLERLAVAPAGAPLAVIRRDQPMVLTLQGRAGCAVLFQIRGTKAMSASAARGSVSGQRPQWVSVSAGMVNFAAEDAEIAVVLGHELAHLVTDSEAQRARPPARTGTRQREARADRVGLRLAACAGYDPAAAAHFWQRYAASRWIDVLGNLGHPSSRTRARDLAAEAQQLRQSSDAGCGPELVD